MATLIRGELGSISSPARGKWREKKENTFLFLSFLKHYVLPEQMSVICLCSGLKMQWHLLMCKHGINTMCCLWCNDDVILCRLQPRDSAPCVKGSKFSMHQTLIALFSFTYCTALMSLCACLPLYTFKLETSQITAYHTMLSLQKIQLFCTGAGGSKQSSWEYHFLVFEAWRS